MNYEPIECASATGLEWVKSSYSGTNNNCVEVAQLPGSGRAVRDSKRPAGPAFSVSSEQWAAFTTALATRHFDV